MHAPSQDDADRLWEAGYASREAVVSNLLALRDCATCPPLTPEQHEHIEALIRLYRRRSSSS